MLCGWRIMLADQPSELIGVMCSSWRQQSREAQQLSLVTVTKPVSLDPALHQLGLQLFSIKAEELRREQQPTTHYPNHYTYQYQCFPYMHLARGGPLKPRHWPHPRIALPPLLKEIIGETLKQTEQEQHVSLITYIFRLMSYGLLTVQSVLKCFFF